MTFDTANVVSSGIGFVFVVLAIWVIKEYPLSFSALSENKRSGFRWLGHGITMSAMATILNGAYYKVVLRAVDAKDLEAMVFLVRFYGPYFDIFVNSLYTWAMYAHVRAVLETRRAASGRPDLDDGG